MTVEELEENVRKAKVNLRELEGQLEEAKAALRKEKKYKVGMRFTRPGSTEQYIFAQTKQGEVALISAKTGNRWYDSKIGKAFDISEREFRELFDTGWEEVS